MPLADIATPNAFECAWLAGASDATQDRARSRRARPRPPAAGGPRHLRAGDDARAHRQSSRHGARRDPLRASAMSRRPPRAPATFSPRSSSRAGSWARALPKAAETALASVFEIVAGTAKAGADELLLAALQDSIVTPHASVVARRLGPGLRAMTTLLRALSADRALLRSPRLSLRAGALPRHPPAPLREAFRPRARCRRRHRPQHPLLSARRRDGRHRPEPGDACARHAAAATRSAPAST